MSTSFIKWRKWMLENMKYHEVRHCSYHITTQSSKIQYFKTQISSSSFGTSLLRIWGKLNAQYHCSAMSFFKVSLYRLKPFPHDVEEELAYTLNWHLNLCQNYYNVNLCNEFFCKKCHFIGFSTYRLWKGNEASILYLGRTISSKTQAKLRRLASSKPH